MIKYGIFIQGGESMKKIIAFLLIASALSVGLVGCGEETQNSSSISNISSETQLSLSKMNAAQITEYLKAQGLPITNEIDYAEENDPNELLGRPNQYTSKVNFADSRITEQYDIENNPVGGTIEVFTNSGDATKRKEYVEAIAQNVSFATQYIYQYDNVVLRLAYELTPTQAEEYNTVMKALYEGKGIEVSNPSSSETSSKIDYSSLKPSQQIYSISLSSSSGVYGEYAFEVTNTFDQAVKIENYTVDFIGNDGTILESDKSVNIVPRIIQPGEKAYCGSTFSVDTTENPDDIKEMVVHLNGVRVVKSEVELLDFSNLNVLKSSGNEFKITGMVENNTSKDVSLGSVTVVALGENDKLLAAKYIGIDNLNKGNTQTIETTFRNQNLNIDDIKKVIATGYDFTGV